MNLYVNLTEFDEIAHEQVRVSEFIYKLNEIDRIAYEQVEINKLSVNLTELTKLLINK